MGFEIVSGMNRGRLSIESGTASVNVSGVLTLTSGDLHRAGISKSVTVMVDAATRRIALRPPKEDEPTAVVRLNKSKSSGLISICPALAALKVERKAARGRYELFAKDDLLIIKLK